MIYITSKDQLFASSLPEGDVELGRGAGWVKVRALSRAEQLHVQAAGDDIGEADRRVLALGMVRPELIIAGLKHRDDAKRCEACADAGRWQAAVPADVIEPVTDRIAALSGMQEGADGKAYMDFEADPGSEFRVLPGRPAEADGSGAPGVDQQ